MANLHNAILSGSADAVRQILLAYPTQQDKQRLVETCNKAGSNALHVAAGSGSADVVKQILLAYPTQQDKQRLVETCDKDGSNALHAAARSGSADAVKQILLACPTQQDKQRLMETCDTFWGRNALHDAAYSGSADVVKQILLSCPTQQDKQRLVETCDTLWSRNALHAAAVKGSVAVVEQILLAYPTQQDKQRLVETCDTHGNNALHAAAFSGKTALVYQLLSCCPPPSRQKLLEKCGPFGNVRTILAFVGQLTEHDIINSSLQALCATDGLGNTALHYAVLHQPLNTLKACAERYQFQPSDTEGLLATKNTLGICPVGMLHCDPSSRWHQLCESAVLPYVIDTEVHVPLLSRLLKQFPHETAHAALKLANLIQSCYFVPMHVASETRRVYLGSALILSNTFREGSHGFCGDQEWFRKGWEREQQFVVDAMERLNVQYKVHNDVTACEMVQIVKSFASHADKPVTFFFIMSHGKESNLVMGNDGKEVCVGDLVHAADVSNLKGQPKLFFVQACRGEQKPEDFEFCKLLKLWCPPGSAHHSNTLWSRGTSTPRRVPEGVAPDAFVSAEVVEEEHQAGASATFNSHIVQPEIKEPAQETAAVANPHSAPGGQNVAVRTNEQLNLQPAILQNASHTAGMLNTSSSAGPPAKRRRTTVLELPKDFLLCQCTLSTDKAERGVFMEILSQCLVEFSNGEKSIGSVLEIVNGRLRREACGQCLEWHSTLKPLTLRK